MTLLQIVVLVALAAAIGQLKRGRQLVLLAASTAIVFWLQPAEPLASLGFWLPIATLALTVISWILTSYEENRSWQWTWPAVLVIGGVSVVIWATGRAGLHLNQSAATPGPFQGLVGLLALVGAATFLYRWRSRPGHVLTALIIVLVAVFVVMKTSAVTRPGADWWLASGFDSGDLSTDVPFSFLGYSYVAFRLLHTIRDRQSGRLPAVSLGEYVTYVIFFPAFTAGPIDRAERFIQDLRASPRLRNDDWLEAGRRLVMGLFKKFVVAELLGVISFSDVLVEHIQVPGWMWVFLYAYALRIYLDFSGYTDVAIGMGRLMGVRLPENFESPYLKPNIALFWNSWHMSLTQWFRSYIFNPLARRLRSTRRPMPSWLALLTTQLVTMVLIGLWHGMTWSFALWGLWHGLGLFVHNRWSEWVRGRWPGLTLSPQLARVMSGLGVFLTFNFVAMGWLFFGLSTPALAWQAIRLLAGVG